MSALKRVNEGGVVVVTFANGRILEEKIIQQIGIELMEAVTAAIDTKKLRIDFSGVQVMSSAMLGKLVLLNKKAKHTGIDLEFCDMSPDVFRLFGGDRGPGAAAVPAQPRRPPDTDAAHAIPERTDD